MLQKQLSARTLGCGNDLVEALITAQIIPARIEAEIAVCRAGRDRRDNFELLERAIALAGPRVNQRQVGDELRPFDRVLGNRHELDRAKCLADRVFFSAKPGIKVRGLREVGFILGLVAPCRVHLLARSSKHRPRFLLCRRVNAQLARQPNFLEVVHRERHRQTSQE